jgi:predicted nucleic acid-binding protein
VTVAYLDTSALVKQYLAERGSAWVRSLLTASQPSQVFTSHPAFVEATCAFARRRREEALSCEDHLRALEALEYDMTYRYNILDVTPEIIDGARHLATAHPLRAYDAVQLASALFANNRLVSLGQPSITFVCADDVLIAVAQAEGLSTDNPNRHP